MDKQHKTIFGELETICWACKRATCNPDRTCPWARFGKPVPGWDAEPTVISNSQDKMRSYLVKSCPLYDESDKFLDFSTFLWDMARVFGCSKQTAALPRRIAENVKKYEEMTGEKMPVWIHNEAQRRYDLYRESQSKQAIERRLETARSRAKRKGEEFDEMAAIQRIGEELGILKPLELMQKPKRRANADLYHVKKESI